MVLKVGSLCALLLLVIGVFISGCTRTEETQDAASLEDNADRIMHNAEIEFSDEGLLTAKLHARKLLFFDKEHRIFGYEIDVDFFDSEGREAGKLTADSGWVDNETRKVTVYGRVHVIVEDGTQLWADSLSYNPANERIKTESDVRINRGGEYLTGNSFDSDFKLEDIHISGNVSGRLSDN